MAQKIVNLRKTLTSVGELLRPKLCDFGEDFFQIPQCENLHSDFESMRTKRKLVKMFNLAQIHKNRGQTEGRFLGKLSLQLRYPVLKSSS